MNDDPSRSEARNEAHALMEKALVLLDIAKDHMAAAKLDDAICALGLRDS